MRGKTTRVRRGRSCRPSARPRFDPRQSIGETVTYRHRAQRGDIRERAAISEPTQLLGTYLGSGPGRPEYQYRAEMIFVRHMRGN